MGVRGKPILLGKMADINSQSDQLTQQESVESQKKEYAEKLQDEQDEERSIASALQGDGDDDQDLSNDLEKATTQASRASNAPVERVKTAADWSGSDDPGNPQNWALLFRAYHTLSIGTLSFAVTCGSSIITPATPEIEAHFDVSRTVAILPLTLYVLGLGFGPILAAPVSETFGRNVVYKITAPIFILFLAGSGLSKSFASLCVCRALAGIVGGPVLAVGAGTSADLYPTHNRAVATSMFIMMPFLGPSLGPVIGGFAADFKGWRWTQWSSIIIA